MDLDRPLPHSLSDHELEMLPNGEGRVEEIVLMKETRSARDRPIEQVRDDVAVYVHLPLDDEISGSPGGQSGEQSCLSAAASAQNC